MLQLRVGQAQRQVGAGGLGAVAHRQQALADAVGHGADLRRRHLAGGQRLRFLQQRGHARQLVLAVPGQQLGELVAHLRVLRAVEIQVAVEPPVAHRGQVVVGQLDRAAGAPAAAARPARR
jgi:hypothetical protein